METALSILKDAMLTTVISITIVKIKRGDAHAVELLLFIVLLFTF